MVDLLKAISLATGMLLIASSTFAQSEYDAIAAAAGLPSPGMTILDPSLISEAPEAQEGEALSLMGIGGPNEWTKPQRLSSTLQVMLMMTVISLAPAVLLMTTCLRQALGTQQAPPSQVLTSITLFVTLLVMTPVWTESYENGIKPYTDGQITIDQAFANAAAPMRDFMGKQIELTKNEESVRMFLRRLPEAIDPETNEIRTNYKVYDLEEGYEYVPLAAILPAYMLSELKTAFLIGFQVYLPFVILDIVVASVTISMGMLMLPPVLISLPFKLLLFVLLDGWTLVIGMLMESFMW
jgi:flagellar biosynthetic protein FliP